MDAYDYKKNTLFFLSRGITFDIKLRGYKNIVGEDSGTGKTLLWNSIYRLKELKAESATNFSFDNILPLNHKSKLEEVIPEIEKQEEILVIIDKANLLASDIINYIINDEKRVYLIFDREIDFNVSPNYYASFQKDVQKKEITISYLFNQKGWF